MLLQAINHTFKFDTTLSAKCDFVCAFDSKIEFNMIDIKSEARNY